MTYRLKRVYDEPSPEDGMRVLVDRLWPRGLSKERASIDLWLKPAAPSDALRKWYAMDPDKWDEFARRYRAELKAAANAEEFEQALAPILERARKRGPAGIVTLLYAKRDDAHTHATVLQEFLEGRRHDAAQSVTRGRRDRSSARTKE